MISFGANSIQVTHRSPNKMQDQADRYPAGWTSGGCYDPGMIVYACSDLIFASKVHGTAEALGVGARPTRDPAALKDRLDQTDDGKLNEPVTGFVLDLELGEPGLALLEQVKQFDNDIPVVAFGSHVHTEALQAAHDRGADFVLPRSQFSASLPAIIKRLATSA